MAKKKLTTMLDEELLKELKIRAIIEDVRLNQILETALREYFAKTKKKGK